MVHPGGVTVGYEYDDVPGGVSAEFPGQRTRIVYPTPGTSVAYTYDKDGRMKTVADWLGKQTQYSYDDAGRLSMAVYPSGKCTLYAYDQADRLVNMTNRTMATPPACTQADALVSSFVYALDAVGNRTHVIDSLGLHQYKYDALHRLTEANYAGPDIDTYTYDANGNRLTKTANGVATNYAYNAADQMTSAGGVSYFYDNAGNHTNRGSDSFQWDHENRLKQTTISGSTATSTYNGDGLRTSHTSGGVTTNYTWDVAAGLPVVLEDGTNRYVYGLDLISATDNAGAQTYFLYDGLGSTTEVVSGASGSTLASYRYDAFGAIRAQTGASANYWLFTGEQRDGGEGLYYLRARYYDPETGRFLSRDPLPSGNLYPYAASNPVNLVDPSGLVGNQPGLLCAGQFNPECEAAGGGGVGGIIIIVLASGAVFVVGEAGGAAVEGVGDVGGRALDATGIDDLLGGGSKQEANKQKPTYRDPIPHGLPYEKSWLGVVVWEPGEWDNWTPPGWRCRDHLPAWFCYGAAPAAFLTVAGATFMEYLCGLDPINCVAILSDVLFGEGKP